MISYNYKFSSIMEPISPRDCLIFSIKCPQIFNIDTLFIDETTSLKICMPDLFSKSIMVSILLVEMSLLSLQKNSSIGASSGVYCGKKIHHQFLSFK